MFQPALLALEDGSVFQGRSIGIEGETTGELIFNTAMSGYQEILTDPSYTKQLVTFTCPHIGNVGINFEDIESSKIYAAGCVVRDVPNHYSDWRAQKSLQDYLREQKIVGISDVDTRAITHILREKGAQKACILAGKIDARKAVALARDFSGLEKKDLAAEVSTDKAYSWNQTSWQLGVGYETNNREDTHVVVYDFGVKQNILRLLASQGCKITVVPAKTPVEEVLALRPNGVLLSNGPGDPAACGYAIQAVQFLLEKEIPLLGICLGFQLLALACRANTVKMKFGHHGANHPVIHVATKQVSITSQNHSFAVDENSLPECLEVTHRSLFDGSLQGIRHKQKLAFGFQGHPEASPGPHDLRSYFDDFIKMISEYAEKS